MPFRVPENAIVCSRTTHPTRCFYCDKRATIVCDFPAKLGNTCDRQSVSDWIATTARNMTMDGKAMA